MDSSKLRPVGANLERPMVSVLMSVWNTPPRMLERSIASVLAQTLGGFEFLIVDDGSTEPATLECLRQAAACDARIRWYREAHRGVTVTLNRGLALAQGDLIARQDADDWSEPRRLELQCAYLDAHPEIALVGSAAWTHQDDGTELWPVRMPQTHERILEAFWRGNPFVHGSVLFRAAEAREAGGYRPQLPCSQDYDFFWRLAQYWGAANLPEPLYHYRYSAQSVSASRAAEQAQAGEAARLLAGARFRGEAEDVGLALAVAAVHSGNALRDGLKQADHLMLAGHYRRAAREYWKLARSRPASLVAWAKLARLVVFSLAPPARRLSFRWP